MSKKKYISKPGLITHILRPSYIEFPDKTNNNVLTICGVQIPKSRMLEIEKPYNGKVCERCKKGYDIHYEREKEDA